MASTFPPILDGGVAYWRNGDDERVVILTAFAQMIALDAKTGKPVPTFGTNGRIDLAQGLRRRSTATTTP
jgi:quinoprotein glucose dehydrogenase